MPQRQFLFGAESAYTTVATTWRRISIEADDHKSVDSELSFRGIGDGGGAPALDAFDRVAKGATGTIRTPVLTNGLGLFNRAAGTSFASAVVDGGTLAYEQITTFGDTGAPANRSISTVAYRDRADGTVDSWLHTGGMPTQVEISFAVDEYVMIAYTMDYAKVERESSTPSRTPTVPVARRIPWSKVTATLTNLDTDASNVDCLKSGTITIPLSLDTEDYCIGDTIKHRPTRAGLPEPTVNFEWKYRHPRYYDAYAAGIPFGLVLAAELDDPIEDATVPSFTVEIPAFVHDANDPVTSVDDPTMQSLPGKVKWNGTDPSVTFTQITSDTAH
jgi:hypothetical protein